MSQEHHTDGREVTKSRKTGESGIVLKDTHFSKYRAYVVWEKNKKSKENIVLNNGHSQ